MTLSDRIIDLLKRPRSIIETDDDNFFFDVSENIGNPEKGLSMNTDEWVNIHEEYWQISYSIDGDFIELIDKERVRVQEWIWRYVKSCRSSENDAWDVSDRYNTEIKSTFNK